MPEPHIPTWRKPIDAFAGTKLGSAMISRLGPILDVPLMRLTRGRVAMTFGLPALLITTTGRKSGQPRSSPLVFQRDGDDLVVIGTKFGADKDPAWALNLRANPEATVLEGGEERRVRARECEGDERARFWERATRMYGGYEKYAARVGARQIPIFVLERISADRPPC